jgi:uridine kinase
VSEVAAEPAASVLERRVDAMVRTAPVPVVVALDGRSGAGKSTLAWAVGVRTGALVIDGDDFYRGGSDEYWRARTPAEKVELVIDWGRQRDVLERLRRAEPARWQPYDWDADDGRLAPEVTGGPADVVILDGAYSARPELSGVLSLRVLLHVGPAARRQRLLGREGERFRAEWEARWSAAEDLYFETLMPPASFDLVLNG